MTRLSEGPGVHFEASSSARRPAEWRGLTRDEVRLVVATPQGITHAQFQDLPQHLRAGDVLVINNSATVAGEIDGTLDDTAIVLHVSAGADDDHRVVELRSAPDAVSPILDAAAGDVVVVGRARVTLRSPWPHGEFSPAGRGNRLWQAHVRGDLDGELGRSGRPIAYGYLDRRYPLDAYQTVFGTRPGSAEMASAARPFTESLVTALVSRGISFAPVTLHTGFSSQEAGEVPGPEWFDVPAWTARTIETARAAGGRIVAVGTTATRAIESAVRDGVVVAAGGWTSRIITPLEPPRVVDGLITGWHDPHASHLLLVEAVAGRALTQAAYDEAVSGGYLWHEFGDSALLLPDLRGPGHHGRRTR